MAWINGGQGIMMERGEKGGEGEDPFQNKFGATKDA